MAEKNECTSCSNNRENCGCVGYAYVPIQELCSTYDDETALKKGSLFPSLDLSICEYGNTCRETGGIING